jgi:hypothetical protein
MIIIWTLGLLGLIIVITVLLNIFKNWKTLMNYKNLFSFFGIGIVLIGVFFSFIEVGLLIQVISFTILTIVSLFYGAFKK